MSPIFPNIPRKTRLLLTGVLVSAMLMLGFAWVETQSSRDEILQSIRAEAGTLIGTLRHASEASMLSMAELEGMLIDRLETVTGFTAHLAEHASSPVAAPGAIASRYGVDVIAMADGDGVILSATAHDAIGTRLPEDVVEDLRTRVARDTSLVIDGLELPGDDEPIFALLRLDRRTRRIILAGMHISALLDVRRRIGIGRLIQNIASNPDIRFLVLQDREGILAASRGVEGMDAIDSDSFLVRGLASEAPQSRIIEWRGEKVMEVTQRLAMEDGTESLIRLGISLDNARAIQQSAMKRVFLMAGVLVLASGLLIGFLLTRQRYATLSIEHERVRSYTGLVLDSIADGVVAVDRHAVVTVMNAAACTVLGRNEAEVLGQPCQVVCPEDALLLMQSLQTGQVVEYAEVSIVSADGAPRILGISTSIIRDRDGAIDTVVAVMRDLTERRRIQERLERREKLSALGELAAGVAHEIRNPLNAISIIAQRFEKEFVPTSDAEEYRQLASTVRSEARRVNAIITQFLEFARPPKLRLEPCELGAIVVTVAGVVESQARLQGVDIHTSSDDGIIIPLDRDRFTQVLLNLFQNALDAMPTGGTLSCTVTRTGTDVVVVIRDSGAGIPADIRAKIFNLYFTTKSTGTGLGLSVVHQIVSEHDGEIEVDSEPGHGTTFRITLHGKGGLRS